MTDWRIFLQQSVTTWQEYTTMFQTQAQAMQENLDNALEALVAAKRNFHEQSAQLKENDTETISDDDKEPQDSEMTLQLENSKRIHEGLTTVVTSLQDLTEKAEIEEQKAKRQRKAPDPTDDEVGELSGSSLPSMQPFGVPGNKWRMRTVAVGQPPHQLM